MSETTVVTYSGTTPGTDASTYVLFSSVVAFPGKRYAPNNNMNKFVVRLSHSHGGNLLFSKSTNRGTNWQALNATAGEAIAAPAAGTETVRDYLVEALDDFKVEWVNGGTAQSPWAVSLTFVADRGPIL